MISRVHHDSHTGCFIKVDVTMFPHIRRRLCFPILNWLNGAGHFNVLYLFVCVILY